MRYFLLSMLTLGLLLGTAHPAAAHTELLQAVPGPGQRAGGDVDFVDLAFLEPVSDATIEVSRGGKPVPGSMVVTDGSIVRFELDEPLTIADTYQVAYRLTSFDLDQTDESFTFTFDPEAPQAQRIGDPGLQPTGRNWLRLGASAVLIVALGGLAYLILSRLEAKRRLTTPDGQSPDGQSSDEAGTGG